MQEKRPIDYSLHVREIVSVLQMKQAKEPIEAQIHQRMRMKIADAIAHTRIRRTDDEHATQFELSVYVLSAHELYRLINDEARRIALRPYDLG
jgi:hypothetical protein